MTESPRQVALPAGGTDILTGRTVGPALDIAPLGVVLVKAS
jgi:hypothetical protein